MQTYSESHPQTAAISSYKQIKRSPALDFLKGISIIMVVFFHNIQLNPNGFLDNLFMLSANAAVPCFFLVSGTLFFHRPFHMKKHLQKMIRFYAIMVIWRTFYLAFYVTQGTPLTDSLKALVSYLLFFQNMPGVETSHFWFMDAMLTVMLIAPVFHLCWNYHRTLVWYIMAILFLFNQLLADGNLFLAVVCPLIGKSALDISSFAEINPLSFRHSNYMLYYFLGAVLTQYSQKEPLTSDSLDQKVYAALHPFLNRRFVSVWMMCFGLAGLVFIKYLQSGTILWQGLHVASGYYWVSTMILACGAFLFCSHLPFDRFPILGWFARTVGTSTMGIFYLHIPLIFLLRNGLFSKLSAYNGWLLNLAESILITAIALLITWVGKKIPVIKYLFQG